MKQIGEVLQGRRERMGLTLAELEKRTHIQREILVHIEKNEFDLLKYPEYAKGFIQKYAHAVNMDGKILISEHEAELPSLHYSAKKSLTQLRQNPERFVLTSSNKEQKWLGIFIACTIILTGVFWGILSLML